MADDSAVKAAREWLDKAGLGDVRYGCADMCSCERCRRTLAELLETFARERVLAEAKAIKAEVQAAFDRQPEAGPTDTRLAYSWVLARCRQRIKQIEGRGK
jgi:hypothetical protein